LANKYIISGSQPLKPTQVKKAMRNLRMQLR